MAKSKSRRLPRDTVRRMPTRLSRVNSASPAHRAIIQSQQEARRRSVTFGQLKTHFITKSGQRVANPLRHQASNPVEVETFGGKTLVMEARTAMEMISEGTLPNQFLGPPEDDE